MTQTDFVKRYYTHAINTELNTGLSAIAILAQAALESAWGRAAPGNMFFGVKDTDGVNGNEQLLITTEYSRRNDLTFPVIISVTPIVRNNQKWYKYKVKDYFRKYTTPEECFTDHARFFFRNKRYADALKVRGNTDKFIDEITKAGYATDPTYADKLKKIAGKISSIIAQQALLPKQTV